MFRIFRVGPVLALIAALSAQAGEFGVVARVNGEDIGAQRFEGYYQAFLTEKGRNAANIRDPRTYKQLRQEALDAYIDEELLWQEARRQGLAAKPEEVDAALTGLKGKFKTPEEFTLQLERGGHTEDSLRDQLKRQLSTQAWVAKHIAPTVSVSPAEIHKYYKANRARFQVPEQVRIRHILVKVEQGATAEQRAAARAQIEAILREARLPGTDFGALAKRSSQDAGAERGGDLGYIARGQTAPAFEKAAFALRDGQVSEVVETEYGLHILRREAHRQGQLAEAEVRDGVRAYLMADKTRQAVGRQIETLRRAAKIETAGNR